MSLFSLLRLPIKYLKFTGTWPAENESFASKALAAIVHILFFEVIILLQFVHIFTLKDFEEMPETLRYFFSYLSLLLKGYNLAYNLERIKSLMDSAKELLQEDDWTEKNHNKKLKQQLLFVARILSGSMVPTVLSFVFIISIPFQTHKLSVKMFVPYDYQRNELLFWLTVIYQNLSVMICIPTILILDIIPVLFMAIATGFIEELNECLQQLNADADHKELVKLLKIHLKIKKFANDMSEVFSPMLIVQGFITVYIMCTTCFLLTKVSCDRQR